MAYGNDDFDFDIDELSAFINSLDSDGTGINVMQEEMDKEMKRLESRLAKEYKQAEKELTKRADDYFARFAERDKQMSKKVADGQMSMDDYINWRKNKILYGENLKAQINQMSEYLASVNQQAMDVVNGSTKGVYAHNYNFGKYEVEKGFGINTSFTLFDERSVVRLARKNPRLLPNLPPDKMVDIPKDKRWSKRKINNVITQGILQGKPIPKIASDLSSVVGMEKRAAIRNARTAMTGAQNAGRLDSYTHSKALGIKLKKQWMATLDERTRTSHQELDGELAEVDKKFSNGLIFPADPDGKPAEVYNCRCTMVAELDDYPSTKFERYDNIEGKPIENCTYKEWMRSKLPNAAIAPKNVQHTKYPKEFQQLKAKVKNINHVPVSQMDKALSDDEIIQKLAGGDMTAGSCASLSFSFIANKLQLDVTDFRGGTSQAMFSRDSTIASMLKIANADLMTHDVDREAKDAAKILLCLDKDALYYFDVGQHAAIVKTTSTGDVQYLEMQSGYSNGWKTFGSDLKSMENTLANRFGCRKRIDRTKLWDGTFLVHKKPVRVAPISSMEATPEFREMMGYINTATDKQKKGIYGSVK